MIESLFKRNIRLSFLNPAKLFYANGGSGPMGEKGITLMALRSRLAFYETLRTELMNPASTALQKEIVQNTRSILEQGLLIEEKTAEAFSLALKYVKLCLDLGEDTAAQELISHINYQMGVLPPLFRDRIRTEAISICLSASDLRGASVFTNGIENPGKKFVSLLELAETCHNAGDEDTANRLLRVNCVQMARREENDIIKANKFLAIAEKMIILGDRDETERVLDMAAQNLSTDNILHYKSLEKFGLLMLQIDCEVKALNILSKGKLRKGYIDTYLKNAPISVQLQASLEAIKEIFPEFVRLFRVRHVHGLPPPPQ